MSVSASQLSDNQQLSAEAIAGISEIAIREEITMYWDLLCLCLLILWVITFALEQRKKKPTAKIVHINRQSKYIAANVVDFKRSSHGR